MLFTPQNKTIKTVIGLLCLLALVAVAIFLLTKPDSAQTPVLFDSKPKEHSKSEEQTNPIVSIPPTFQVEVPFTSQAPTANWDKLHNEACEEASVIMAWAYFNNITPLLPAVVEPEIDKLTNWQQNNYGYYLSITTPETARMASEVYGLKTAITPISEQIIKQALIEQKLVILPAQGQLLNNPNFTLPGPLYHMLVITGWDSTHFITNDPGTRKGAKYKYTYDTLYRAAGNYSHLTKLVNTDEKQIIIISK
jgi:hypothetical protein